MKIYVRKDEISVVLSLLVMFFSFLYSSYFYLAILFIIFFKSIINRLYLFALNLIISLPVLYYSFENWKIFIIFTNTIMVLGLNIPCYQKAIKFYSYTSIPFIIFLYLSGQKYGDFIDVFNFSERLWLNVAFSENNINPNVLGVFSAISLVYFLNNKSLIRWPIIIFLLATVLFSQSRTALVFVLFFTILTLKLSFYRIIYLFSLLIIIYYFIKDTNLYLRINSNDDSGRLEIFAYYINYIINNFPNVMQNTQYVLNLQKSLSLDNGYFLLLLKFGMSGLIFIILFLILSYLSCRDDKLLKPFFYSILLVSLVENSFFNGIIFWFFLSILISSIRKFKL